MLTYTGRMQKLPPLRALQAFEAVARHSSFKAAAAELNVTPTAISHQIRTLEQACGTALLRRRPRPLRLTPAGERLYPVLHDGFAQFSRAMAAVGQPATTRALRVTSPNAFASRWLVPRLLHWHAAHPDTPLEIIGTDRVLDLAAGEADIAIRYARAMPQGNACTEIARDAFFPVASPALLGPPSPQGLSPEQLSRFPLIHYEWTRDDPQAPTWAQWFAAVGSPPASTRDSRCGPSFREELHAIDAAVAGQGIALCSDVVVGDLLRAGTLRKAHAHALPGLGYYVMHAGRPDSLADVQRFSDWLLALAHQPD